MVTSKLLINARVFVVSCFAFRVLFEQNSISVGRALVIFVHIDVVLVITSFISREKVDWLLHVVRETIIFVQGNKKFVVNWKKLCRFLNIINVLNVSTKESEVQISNNEIEVMPCISLNCVGFGNFRLNLFKNISHHLNSFVSSNSASCQMAINKAKSVLIQSELNAHSPFVADIASKA